MRDPPFAVVWDGSPGGVVGAFPRRRVFQGANMVEQSPTIGKLCAALVAAQAEMRNPPKDSVNPHFKSRFADLATIIDTAKPVLAKHKLGVIQMPCEVAVIGPGLCTMLVHESGEFVRETIAVRPAKTDPQGIGAALTYARRQGYQAIIGVTGDDDDDGNHASKPAPQKQAARQRPTNDDLRALLSSRGWQWAAAVHAINGAEGTEYFESNLPTDINADHLARFCDHLRTLPEVKKTGAAK